MNLIGVSWRWVGWWVILAAVTRGTGEGGRLRRGGAPVFRGGSGRGKWWGRCARRWRSSGSPQFEDGEAAEGWIGAVAGVVRCGVFPVG